MCGRYFFKMDESLRNFYQLQEKMKQLELFDFHEGEIFPSQHALVLLPDEQQEIQPSIKLWGIHGYKGNLLINARSESIHEKMTFRPLLKNRCAIVANGFYEWIKHGNVKDKLYIQKKDQPLFFMAGIYNNQNEFVIVTGESNAEMAKVHKRTPIIMDESCMLRYLYEQEEYRVDNEALVFQKV